jgi:hypothetical protein
MFGFDQALHAAREAKAAGDIRDYFVERKGDSTAGDRYIIARSSDGQGDFIWWPMSGEADEFDYWED